MSLVLPTYVLGAAFIPPWGMAVQTRVARWKGAGDAGRIGRVLDLGAVLCTAVASRLLIASHDLVVGPDTNLSPNNATLAPRIAGWSRDATPALAGHRHDAQTPIQYWM